MNICNHCGRTFYTEHGKNIHLGKSKCPQKISIDLIKLGVISRRLTKIESAEITKEVMGMNLKGSDERFTMAILKAIKKGAERS